MVKKSLEKALFEMDPEIVDEVAKDLCEKRLKMEKTKVKKINFRKRIVLIAATAALVIAAVMIPLAVMMSKKPEPITPPVTDPSESKTEKQNPEVRYKEFIVDYQTYETTGELIEAASNIYEGKVIGVSFELLDTKTGLKAESSDDPNALLYTIYEIEPTATYMS